MKSEGVLLVAAIPRYPGALLSACVKVRACFVCPCARARVRVCVHARVRACVRVLFNRNILMGEDVTVEYFLRHLPFDLSLGVSFFFHSSSLFFVLFLYSIVEHGYVYRYSWRRYT